MPHWNCERCGGRLYSASRRLKRPDCPVCQGRLLPVDDRPQRFGREEANAPGPEIGSDPPSVGY
jgi:hypothetical protein